MIATGTTAKATGNMEAAGTMAKTMTTMAASEILLRILGSTASLEPCLQGSSSRRRSAQEPLQARGLKELLEESSNAGVRWRQRAS